MAARPPTVRDAIDVIEVVEEWRDTSNANTARLVIAVADTSHVSSSSSVIRLRNGDLYNVRTAYELVRGPYQPAAGHRLYEVHVDKWP